MIASMTGFGRSSIDCTAGVITVEILSINRKFPEISVSMPKEWARFEIDVRRRVAEAVVRGQISVRVSIAPALGALADRLPDTRTLQEMKSRWEKLAAALGYPTSVVDLPFLLQHIPEIGQPKGSDEEFAPIRECLDEALRLLVEMKQTEGKALVGDIKARLKTLATLLSRIQSLSGDASARMRQKLHERLGEILAPGSTVDDRFAREIALFAEKVDISEEITRLESHLKQFEGVLKQGERGSGRKMDFLVQEMGREVNTIGSKSMDAQISHLVVEMKSELEKIREQVQNIE
jgi:uncharacterized protein (TIGR00255 family)